jgi:hypothetical protein
VDRVYIRLGVAKESCKPNPFNTLEHKVTRKSRPGSIMSVPKSITRTVRLDADLDAAIQRKSAEEKVTVNFFINRTVRKLVEWDMPARKFGLVMTPEALLIKLLERYDDESCLELGRASAREYIKPLAEYLYGEFSLETSILLFRRSSQYGGRWEFDEVVDLADSKKHVLILRHNQGHKWARYYHGLIVETFRGLLGKNAKVESTDNLCIAQFDV